MRAYRTKLYRSKYTSLTQYFSKDELNETLRPKVLFDPQLRRIGPRIYKYKSGAKYRGTWLGGFRDGKGEIFWKDGASYSGDWSLGHAHG